jgi:endonuclease/exonuclease/phosphatase family metal-dependent hydrolase
LLTAVSYNIHQCVGTDGKRDPQRIATVIQDTKADIIGLQEVDSTRWEKKSHQLDYLAEATGMRAVADPHPARTYRVWKCLTDLPGRSPTSGSMT